jgi:pimeloyl-ACP methyl ester carboxylesterase
MDFVGFGRSDKYTEQADYSFQMHRDTLTGFIEALDLQGITAVVQDWGGLIGLTVASQMPERFARLVIMNTGLPIGEEPLGEAFMRWRGAAERLGTRCLAVAHSVEARRPRSSRDESGS